MSEKARYITGAEKPVMEFWLFDRRGGSLVDLSAATLQLKIGIAGETALLTKTTGLAGSASGSGDGSADADVPNLVATWAANDLALTASTYSWQVKATSGGLDHIWRGAIEIQPAVL